MARVDILDGVCLWCMSDSHRAGVGKIMFTVFFSKNGGQLAEDFEKEDTARRWVKLIERNGFTLEGFLEH